MHKNPLVSIGVPIYNVEPYIRKCAKSLFGQTYNNIEYVFVNDCTQDNSVRVLQDVLDEYPNRKEQVKILNNKQNLGLSATRNTAVDMMTGYFLIWVDSDDYIELDMVEKLVDAQTKTNADIVNCSVVVELPHNVTRTMTSPVFTSPHDMTVQILRKNVLVSVWARLIKIDLYKCNNIKGLNGINNAEDYQVTPRLAYYAKNVTTIPDALYHYNCQNQTSYTARYSVMQSEQIRISVQFLENFFNDKGSDYMYALGCAKMQILARDLVKCCRSSFKTHYYKTLKLIREMDPKYKKSLSIPFRIILMMPDFYTAKIYVMIASLLKKR